MPDRELRNTLRRELPAHLFRPRPWRALWALPIAAVIVAGTWAVIALPLPLVAAIPLSLVVGNNYASLLHFAHEVGHGATVRSRRLQAKVSQAVLGEALGVTFQQVQKYESGSNRIGCGRLLKIADVLKCDQDEQAGPQAGRVVAVLFSEEVTPESVQDRFSAADITNYQIEIKPGEAPEGRNKVVGVALQPGGRIAFLALRDPYGPFIPRTITISGVKDLQGHELLALAGARRILEHVEVVLAEFSFFGQLGEAPVGGLVRFMDEAGFDLFDIASIAGRHRDGRARHGDFVFVRRNTPLWADRSWE